RTVLSPPTPTPTTSTLSLHDALPISSRRTGTPAATMPCCEGWGQNHSSIGRARVKNTTPIRHISAPPSRNAAQPPRAARSARPRSEEHTSELQSLRHLVCRLLLEKKK